MHSTLLNVEHKESSFLLSCCQSDVIVLHAAAMRSSV